MRGKLPLAADYSVGGRYWLRPAFGLRWSSAKTRASLEKPPEAAGAVIRRFPSFLNCRGDRRGLQSQTGA
jgi:hypothetical protein